MNKLKYIFIWLLFVLISLVFTYPAITHLSTDLIGDSGDNYQYASFQYIAKQNIILSGYPFVDSDIFRYPVGFPFGARFDSIFGTLTGAILSFFLSYVISYNLTVLLIFSLNAFFSYLLFRHITKSTIIGIVGAIIYGFSSYAIARSAGHLNLLSIGGFPFFIFAVLKLYEKVTTRNIFLFFLSVAFIFFSSLQYVFILLLLVIIAVPILFLFFKNEVIEFVKKIYPHLGKFFLIGIFFLLLFFVLAFPFMVSVAHGELMSATSSEYVPDMLDFFFPNSAMHLLIIDLFGKLNPSVITIERVVFIGWAELVLFAIFLVSKIKIRIKLFITLVSVIFFILATGFQYDVLSKFFLFAILREPGRFFIVFYLFMVIGIVLFLKYLYGKHKKIAWTSIILLLLFVIFERLPYDYWLSYTFQNDTYLQVVKNQPGNGVLDLPVNDHSVYNILTAVHNKKIVLGNFLRAADTAQTISFINSTQLSKFVCSNGDESYLNTQELLQKLKENNIDTIVVHKKDLFDRAKYYFPECADARMASSLLLPQLFMPNPTEKQEIFLIQFPAILGLGDTLTFQYDGKFYLDGMHVYPKNLLPLHISLDGKELSTVLSWTDRGEGNITTDPKLVLDVKKGSKLRFVLEKNDNAGRAFINIWYRYSSRTPQKPESINGVKKVFDDENAAVFQIE